MATVSKQYTFVAGTKILSSQVNANFDDIYNDYNGNITNANLAANAAIADTKLAQITTGSKVALSALPVSGTAGQTVVTGTGTGAEWAGMTTAGDIEMRGASNRVRLAVGGTAGQALMTGTGGYPEWGGMTATGDVEYRSATNRAALAIGSFGSMLFSNGTAPSWVSQGPIVMGTTSYNSAATGTSGRISGTNGVGFLPKWVLFLSNDNEYKFASSIGVASGVVSGSNLGWYHNALGTVGNWDTSNLYSIALVTGSQTAAFGYVSAFTSGGWNMTWVHGTNAAEGTAGIAYIAFGSMGT